MDNMIIKMTPIGVIDSGCDGRDEYVLLERQDGPLTLKQAKDYLLPKVYRACEYPGGYFCTAVSAAQAEYSENEVICIVQHRYDN